MGVEGSCKSAVSWVVLVLRVFSKLNLSRPNKRLFGTYPRGATKDKGAMGMLLVVHVLGC